MQEKAMDGIEFRLIFIEKRRPYNLKSDKKEFREEMKWTKT
jgi:hypothetical protein